MGLSFWIYLFWFQLIMKWMDGWMAESPKHHSYFGGTECSPFCAVKQFFPKPALVGELRWVEKNNAVSPHASCQIKEAIPLHFIHSCSTQLVWPTFSLQLFLALYYFFNIVKIHWYFCKLQMMVLFWMAAFIVVSFVISFNLKINTIKMLSIYNLKHITRKPMFLHQIFREITKSDVCLQRANNSTIFAFFPQLVFQ